MKFPSKPPFPIAVLSLALALAMPGPGLPSARACGPFFPNSYLAAPESQLLAAPRAFFADEMWRLAAPEAKRPRLHENSGRAEDPSATERTAAADLAELEAALREKEMPEAGRRALVAAYAEARKTGTAGPEQLPAEFAAYWRGALAWKKNQVAEARAAWEAVLALPEAERRRRATWAAYMLGRSHLTLPDKPAATGGQEGNDTADTPAGPAAAERSPDEALRWFRRTRELAATGSADALGLAGEAKGWEARLLAERGRSGDAIRLYLERLAEGDGTAVQSLRATAARLVQEADAAEFERAARDPQARAVAVAWLLARGGTFFEDSGAEAREWALDGEDQMDDQGVFWAGRAKSWAVAIHEAGGRGLPGAERLAWLAYEGGLFALAQDWLRLAPEDSPEADWLRAKLALRGGALDEGARWLERTAGGASLNEAHRPLVYAELARARMAQDQPQAALAAWLAGGHWKDAAFVAERVLTIDELAAVVDAATGRMVSENPLYRSLRHLLARRMARAGQERAERYFPGELRGPFVAYLADVRTGFDPDRPEAERAAAFWRAAQVMKEKGDVLTGTELEPDWEYWGGSFDLGSAAADRTGLPALAGGVFAPTAGEQARIAASPVPERRFHYRYRAAELAWWAASLLPGDSDETAAILSEAGGWLKARDPKAAEPFYQALVIRCGRTELGREAARLHWFPKERPVADAASE